MAFTLAGTGNTTIANPLYCNMKGYKNFMIPQANFYL